MRDVPASPAPAGLLRRIACILYDSLLLFSVLFIGTALVLPFNSGQAISPHHPWYSAYLLALSFLYFGWCWTHGGQTLGMRAWRVSLRRRDRGAIRWKHAAIRFVAALLSWAAGGLGFIWSVLDPAGLTWHDRLSGTTLVLELSPAEH